MKLNARSLDEFILRSDELGGPASPACAPFWMGLEYEPSVCLDQQANPLSPDYMRQQMALYAEITGHDYEDVRDEQTPDVPVERLLHAPNAYDHGSPAGYAEHCVALGLLVRKLELPRGSRVLELGSGWGVTQEFLAACGFDTVGLDANPHFVATSNARLERLGFGKRVQLGTFDGVERASLGVFDAVVAYEAFHHAVDAYDLLNRSVGCLKPDGVFAIAAEPFNDHYCSWGLRLDPLSIYCVRKFGWFESGWSPAYMAYLFGRCGMLAEFDDLPGSGLTKYMVGRRSGQRNVRQLGIWHPAVRATLHVQDDYCFTKSDSRLLVPTLGMVDRLLVKTSNFSTRPLDISLQVEGQRRAFSVPLGEARLEMPVGRTYSRPSDIVIDIQSQTFCPRDEGINADSRLLGVAINGVELIN